MYNKEVNILYIIKKSEINKMKVRITEDIFWVIVNGQSDMVKSGFNEKQKKKLDTFLENVGESQIAHIIEATPCKLKVIVQSNMETIHFWVWKKLHEA